MIFKTDFGMSSPKKTSVPCSKPEFANHNLHRVAIMKNEHFGSKGDRDEHGLKGWTTKLVCVSCKKEFKNNGFYPDSYGDMSTEITVD